MSTAVAPAVVSENPRHIQSSKIARYFLMACSLGFAAYGAWQIKLAEVDNEHALSGNAVIGALAYTEPVKSAIEQKIEGSKALFQISLLILGVLWGLIIAKRDERAMVMTDWPELVMFLVANGLFVASAYCFMQYTSVMATLQSLGGLQYEKPEDMVIMDYRDPRIDNLSIWQVRLWVAALFVAAFALLSAHLLKETPEKGQ